MLTDLKLRKLKYKPLTSQGRKHADKLLGNRYPDTDQGTFIAALLISSSRFGAGSFPADCT
jgi:hypothetical protein